MRGESLMLLLQWKPEAARRSCREVHEGPVLNDPCGMAEEHFRIPVCSGFKKPLAEAWEDFKVWN